MEKSEQILKGMHKWIGHKIDELVGDNIWMALVSNSAKRIVGEYVETILPMNMIVPIFSNHGVIDADVFASEIITALNNTPDISQEIAGGIVIHLTRGVVKVELPSTGIVKTLLGGNNVINFREPDIRELAQYINEAKNE